MEHQLDSSSQAVRKILQQSNRDPHEPRSGLLLSPADQEDSKEIKATEAIPLSHAPEFENALTCIEDYARDRDLVISGHHKSEPSDNDENTNEALEQRALERLGGSYPKAILCVPNFDTREDGDGKKIKGRRIRYDYTPIGYSWSRKILELVGNKARLMESFSWLSTVGGGFSALGERDDKWSLRAGALSLGQQLHLAELLGDERLKVMCHLFAALAALQLDNKHFCVNYLRRVIIPLMNSLPYKDPILTNILRHICFRLKSNGKPRYLTAS